ncbi:MAG: hypothetical protein ACYSSI_11570 [Planctomycetota bacterium]
MTTFVKKKGRKAASPKAKKHSAKTPKAKEDKIAESVNCLLKLHKLQGVMLAQLSGDINLKKY